MFRHLGSVRTTIVVAVLAVLAGAIPGLARFLEIDLVLIGEGQWWRVWTGHLTHYDGNHLFWDLLMFVVLGQACERMSQGRFPLGLAIMSSGVTASLWLWCDGIHTYRGLSGIDTGLFVWLVAEHSRRNWLRGERRNAVLWSGAVTCLVGKLIYEATTGQTLFVDSSNFTPLVESHLAGAAFGLVCLWISASGSSHPQNMVHRVKTHHHPPGCGVAPR